MIKTILSLPYQLVHSLRCLLYDWGICKQKKLPAYTISIGNLSFGGTGKTPVTIAIAKYLNDQGLKVCVLTRGYKGKTKNYPMTIECSKFEVRGSKKFPSNLEPPISKQIGDEPTEMLQAFKDTNIILTIDPNRYRGGEITSQKYPIDVFILDDGMQHLGLARDLEIVLKNINESGFMREFPWAEHKADHVIYTKVDEAWINKNKDSKNFAKFNLALTQKLHPQDSLGVLTGVADPNSLMKMLKNELAGQGFQTEQLEKIVTRFYPDHHFFSLGEVKEVLALGMNIITTEKDLVRIPGEYQDRFVVAKLELEFGPKSLLQDLYKGVTK